MSQFEASLQGPTPRIAVLGLFGSPNLGNEATFAAFVHHVSNRIPGAQFLCIASRRSNIQHEQGIPLIPIDVIRVGQSFWRVRPASARNFLENLANRSFEGKRRRRAIEYLQGVQQFVVPGTGVIDDFGQGPLDLPTDLNRWTWAAHECGLPISFLSIGVSRIQTAESVRLFRRALGRARFLSFRDEISAQNARTQHFASVGQVVPDLAFGLPEELIPERVVRRTARTVGVGLMGYYGWNQEPTAGQTIYERYISRVVAMVCALLRRGHTVNLMIGDTRADSATAVRVVQECGLRGVSMTGLRSPSIKNFRDLLAVIAETDVVVASRFHNVLLALLLQRPTISIGYSDKNTGVMGLFGLQSLCHDIHDFDVEEVLQQVEMLMSDPSRVLHRLAEGLAAARSSISAQFDTVCSEWRGELPGA